jgi:tRNA(Ile)-lysidine synthase
MERSGSKVVLINSRVHGVHEVHGAQPFELHLPIPGAVASPHGSWAVEAEGPMLAPQQLDRGSSSVVVDARELGAALIVRARRPGDRLRPLGAPGRKKVQDVFVDRKVPRDDRDLVPIVTTESGRIVWVAGQALAEAFRVTPLTKSVVVLTLRRT